MSITIAPDLEHQLIRVILRGACDRAQIAASIDQLATDQALLVPADVLWDARDAQIDVTGAEVNSLVDAFARRHEPFPNNRVAVLASTDAIFGLGRMGQAYWEYTTRKDTFMVFRELEAAEAWLLAPH